MGRSPCCDKEGLKKGPWTPEEDHKLLAYIEEHGHGSWRALPSRAGLQRCGKSCRLRWTNYLRPDIKRGKFSLQEEQTIIQLHALLGNRWSAIATHLPKRTDNEIKNYWNTHLKKRLAKMGIDPLTHKPKNDAILSSSTSGQSKNSANLSHMAQWESARLEAEARLVRQSKLCDSSNQLHQQLGSQEFEPPLSLDILKAWNGTWTEPTEVARGRGGDSVVGTGGDLESPTSTLSYSENVPPIPATGMGKSSTNLIEFVTNSGSCEDGMMKEEGEEDWKGLKNPTHYKEGIGNDSASFTSGLQDMTMTTVENGWTPESLRPDNDENVHSGIFVEKFTELLLNNSGGEQSFSEDGGESDDIGDGSGASTGGGDGSADYYEDNKNYWNSILNLVSSSPSDSPMF